MAHIGRPGPYLFRRDLNLNVNNYSAGFYRRYLIKLLQLPPGDANTVNGFEFDCGPDTYPAADTVEWESPFRLVPVFQWKLILSSRIDAGIKYSKTVDLIAKTTGLAARWTWADDTENRFPVFPTFTTLVNLFWDPTWFDSRPNNVDVDIRQKNWADGPPH